MNSHFDGATIASMVIDQLVLTTSDKPGRESQVGYFKFFSPIEGTTSKTSSIPILDWQLEILVEKLGLNNGIEVVQLLNSNLRSPSSIEVVLYTRTVGVPYTNPRTNKDFVLEPTAERPAGTVVTYAELDLSTCPVTLSLDSRNEILERQRIASLKVSEDKAISTQKAWDDQVSFRAEARKRAFELRNSSGKNVPTENKIVAEDILQQELTDLLKVGATKRTADQKARILELQASLVPTS